MLNKTVTVELRSIVTVFCLLGQSPVLHCGVFRDPKNGDVRNKNPPAMRGESNRYTKNHLSVTIELFSHYRKKGKVILWQKRITI